MTPEQSKLELDFLIEIRNALLHSEARHAVGVVAGGNICPEGAILVCGSAVFERLQALRVEGVLLAGNVADASLIINKIRKG